MRVLVFQSFFLLAIQDLISSNRLLNNLESHKRGSWRKSLAQYVPQLFGKMEAGISGALFEELKNQFQRKIKLKISFCKQKVLISNSGYITIKLSSCSSLTSQFWSLHDAIPNTLAGPRVSSWLRSEGWGVVWGPSGDKCHLRGHLWLATKLCVRWEVLCLLSSFSRRKRLTPLARIETK